MVLFRDVVSCSVRCQHGHGNKEWTWYFGHGTSVSISLHWLAEILVYCHLEKQLGWARVRGYMGTVGKLDACT